MRRDTTHMDEKNCRHLWVDLGVSLHNGKRYRRCDRCGQVREDILQYIA